MLLQGELEWLLEGATDELQAVLDVLGPEVCERLGDELLLLNFRNAVGLLEIPGLGLAEVVSSKWDLGHFDWMLSDLMRVASALPFTHDSATALPYDRSVVAREDVLYHAFVYLRHVLSSKAPKSEQLLPALEMVLRDPHRRFAREREDVPAELARRLDARSLLSVASRGGDLHAVTVRVSERVRLARRFGDRLPKTIDQAAVRVSVDTPENRFVKSFLKLAVGVIDGMQRVVSEMTPGVFTQRILTDCQLMERALAPIVRAPLWREVGPMVHLPTSSTVLQRRRGYREVFGHFARLRLAARVPLDKSLVRDLLETKDIALLYEIWCYFALVRIVDGIRGRPQRAGRPRIGPLALTVPWDLEVVWADGTRLLYNARFARATAGSRRSYSVPLRPDIALEVPQDGGRALHLLDAKFRVDKLDVVLPLDDQTDDERVEERRGTFKRGDLYKMHTYRDAIPDAESVWILYPGTELRFFDESRGKPVSVPALLAIRPTGVGALPLTPAGEPDTTAEMVLSILLGEANL